MAQTNVKASLRLSLTGHMPTPEANADRVKASIDMAEYADKNGFAVINVEEHHDAEIGWMSSPLMMAALIASRTAQIEIRASALLCTLYDPIRLAEDIALLDLASRGRFRFTFGQGYRPTEYHMFDRDFERRGEMSDFIIETLISAWTKTSFNYKGETVHVSPRPYTQPHPPIWYGGMSKAAAKRAARHGLTFHPAQPMPEIEQLYLDECKRLGKTGSIVPLKNMTLIFIDENPDKAWPEIGPYALREVNQYSSWARGGVDRLYQTTSTSLEDFRKLGVFEIITPEECLARAKKDADFYTPILHPLGGGIPPERGWACLELFTEKVLKKL